MSVDDDKAVDAAEKIISAEVDAVGANPAIIRGNGCAACHVFFTLAGRMSLSEAGAADLLTEALLARPELNERF
ncbi:MAG: hypothetical protein C4292_00150, partial [Nitrososphaera sp.]